MTPSLSGSASRASVSPTVRDKPQTSSDASLASPCCPILLLSLCVRLGPCSGCHPYVWPAPLVISLFIQPSSRPIPGCRSSISFSRVWWEPCPPTRSGALQLRRQGSARPSRRASAPRTKIPLSNLPGLTIPRGFGPLVLIYYLRCPIFVYS